MANYKCGAINPAYRDLLKGIKKWATTGKTPELFNDPYDAALKLVDRSFNSNIKYLKYRDDVTPGKVSDTLSRLYELSDSVDKGKLGANWTAETFFASSHYGKKDPIIGQILGDFQRTSQNDQKNQLRDKDLMKQVMTSLKEDASILTIAERGGALLADKQYFDLHRQIIDARVRWLNGEEGAQREHERLFLKEKELVDSSYLKVFDKAIDIIEGVKNETTGEWEYGIPKAIVEKFKSLEKRAKKDISNGRKHTSTVKRYNDVLAGDKVLKLDNADIMRWVTDKNGNQLSAPMAKAITSYNTLMDGLYTTLRRGVDKRIDSIVKRMEFLGDTSTADQFKELKVQLRGKYMPKYEQGFFPHYTRGLNVDLMSGLMESFDNMQSSANIYDMKRANPKDVIKSMKLHVDKHTMARQKTNQGDSYYGYSRNFFDVVTNYMNDVNRFNHKSYTDSHLLDALTSIETMYKNKGTVEDYSSRVTEFILDLTKAANGDYGLGKNERAIMRTILSLEFVSKLGVNPRGAVRNLTQRFLDYVHWGPVQVHQMKNYLKDMRIQGQSADNYIESVLQENGLLFEESAPQVLETQMSRPAKESRLIEYNSETNKYESNAKGKLERFADASGTLASKSSILHRKAENSNRKHTFKLGYAQMHKWLSNPQFVNELVAQGKTTEAQQEAAKRGIAERYAMNMVLMNHFDYADYAKSKALRNKYGRFMGQFQHYSFEFFEKNHDIMREAKHDLKTRNFNILGDAQGLAKATRMSMIYFLAPLIAGTYMGLDFSSLIQHDTAERLNQFKVAFTGDEDEIAQAFYGKGPVLATFGGPLISDLIEVGMMMELIDLDEDSIWSLFHGLEKRDPDKRSTKTTQMLRILNTFLGRFAERHAPLIAKGGMGAGVALQQEMGIYPTAAAKKRQRRLLKARKKLMPEGIEGALRQLEGRT